MVGRWARALKPRWPLRLLALVALVTLGLAGLQGWAWYSAHEARMSRPPPFVPQPLPLTPRESRVGVRAHLAYKEIRAAVEAATEQPQTGEQSGETCREMMGASLCVGWHAEYAVRRAGRVGVARHGERVRLTLPLALAGRVDFHGALATLLGLGERDFEGALDAIVDLALDVDAGWCPVVGTDVDVAWRTRPRLELRAGDAVDLGDQVEAPLREALGALQEQIRRTLSCELVRAQVARLWRRHSFPLGASPGQGELHANLVPTGLALSRVAAEADRLAVTARLTARAEIASAPVAPAGLPLPALARAPRERGAVALSVPVRLPYERLRHAAAEALVGKTFRPEVALGRRVTLRVTSVDVYPSGERIAVALGFVAETGLRMLDGSGTLYVSGRPRIVGPTGVELAEFGLSRVVDNPLWQVASLVFQDEILDALRALARFDLQAEADEAARLATAALMRHTEASGLELHLDPPRLALRDLSTAEHELVAEVEIGSAAELRLKGSILRLP